MSIQDWYSKPALKIGIATDHGGWEIKQGFAAWLRERGLEVVDYGPFVYDSLDDYPDFANKAMRGVSSGEVDIGLLVCRSGVGMGITANRYCGIRAAVAYSPEIARASRNHNCSNVLVLPADYAEPDQLKEIAAAWLETPFSGDLRHVRRLEKIESGSFLPISRFESEDSELADALFKGITKRDCTLDLVASENRTSSGVRAAMGSYLTDKYAAGYPGARLYSDCETADVIENLCIERACRLFGAEAANVQPYSGSLANLAAYHSVVLPGEPVMAMHPGRGGHSSHFSAHHISGKQWKVIPYELDPKTEQLDYDAIEKMAVGCRPKLIVAGGSSYVRSIDFERFRAIADRIHAVLMVDMAHSAGLVAAGLSPNPVPYADIVTSTTHKTFGGPRGGLILCKQAYIEAVNQSIFPMLQGGPLLNVIAAKALAMKEASSEVYISRQKQVIANAQALSAAFGEAGIRSVTGGTDCHMILLDLRSLGMNGLQAAKLLEAAGINTDPIRIPSDPLSSPEISGLRLGTSVVTVLGMKEAEMTRIAQWILSILRHPSDIVLQEQIQQQIAACLEKLALS